MRWAELGLAGQKGGIAKTWTARGRILKKERAEGRRGKGKEAFA